MSPLKTDATPPPSPPAKKARADDAIKVLTDEEYNEQFTRTSALLSASGFEKFNGKKVAIIGCGGVGSHCASMLVRSGLQNLKLVDFDDVTVSSLNRHAVATWEDVGKKKVVAMKEHFSRISPRCSVEALEMMMSQETLDSILKDVDFVVDCIDNTPTKVSLIKTCHERKIPMISSMGAGGRIDPTTVEIIPLGSTQKDPLAAAIRRNLRKAGSKANPMVVCGSQVPYKAMIAPSSDEIEALNNADQDSDARKHRFRIGVVPVYACSPASWGNAAAAYAIATLSDNPKGIKTSPPKVRTQFYKKLHNRLSQVVAAEKLGPLTVTLDQVSSLVEDVYGGSSVLSKSSTALQLVPWLPENGYVADNLILVAKDEGVTHSKLESTDKVKEHYGKEEFERVSKLTQLMQ
eukprot:TRINITY_DN4799_c0_g1_i1.p1 TRINITY_DN4799_c0_g1~~TRINITY_DN4799_c0_g1_i1.p1  ORF type:complete len:405 (+),score=101.80 TRINITY_DN4799_c0_g1_i1:17-1231(+)